MVRQETRRHGKSLDKNPEKFEIIPIILTKKGLAYRNLRAESSRAPGKLLDLILWK